MSTLNQLLNRKNVRNVIVGGSEDLYLYVEEHLVFHTLPVYPLTCYFYP